MHIDNGVSDCFCTGKYAGDIPCMGSAHYV